MSWPASLAMLNTTVIKFVDGLMVSYLGHSEFSAQYASGMLAFAPEAFAMGLLLVVNTYVSQNFGAGRHRRSGQYAWAGIFLALGFATLIVPLVALARPIFSALNHSEQLQGLEVMYFRYMILAAFLTLPSRVLEQFFFGIHRPRIVLTISLIANAFNVLANYALIFGRFGLPAMGLEGAAIGSVSAWTLQLVILLVVFVSPRVHRTFGTLFVRSVRRRHCAELLRIGWPAGVQLCNDVLCWGLFTVVLVGTFFGKVHMAATTVAMRYLGLSFMPALGIGIATTALVGRYIGAGRLDLARKRVHQALLVAMIYMGLCGLAFWMFRYPMVRFLLENVPSTLAAETRAQEIAATVDIAVKIMLCAAVFQLFDAVGIVYIGALRGAGDVLWPMAVTAILSWGIILGGGYMMVIHLPWLTSIGPWITASAYVMVLGIFMARRFESGAWRRINLLGRARKVQPTPVADPIAGMPELAATEEPQSPEERAAGMGEPDLR
ncbi:MAG: MATE family efflux transporter [Phycisphaerae bacterium]|nr:MATE family efflux transporter [Phycisphaerae bacterium]